MWVTGVQTCALPIYIRELTDVADFHRLEIQHFFETYKDLEPGKSVEGAHWVGKADAEAEITASYKRREDDIAAGGDGGGLGH